MSIRTIVLCAALASACGKSDTGSAGSASSAGSGSAPQPADLPPRSAPGTPEVLAQFDRACDAGTAGACFDAGMRRAKGMGATADRVAAISWLEKGCKLDDLDSCGLLAGFIATGDQGVKKDTARAISIHQKICPRRAASCTALAGHYFDGDGVAKDPAKAEALLDQGCYGGDGRGCELLAQLIAPRDPARAVELATKGCDTDAYHCETLGAFYIGGTGVAKDADRGVAFVEKACKAGSTKACDGLKILRGR